MKIDNDVSKFNVNALKLKRSKYNTLIKFYTITKKFLKKTAIYYNILSRFNVHIDLYYENVAVEYVIFNNYIIFINENKHRFFKRIILLINH